MAIHKRLSVLSKIKNIGLVPLFYNKDPELAINIVKAVVDGGCQVLEFTNRGDRALYVFLELVKYRDVYLPELMLGVGSVINAPTAAMYIQAGADFIVAPLFDEETAKVCNSQKVSYMPGCGSVTEIHQAHLTGVEMVKIFPAGQVGGPAFIKSVLGPCPWAELMPSGGVNPDRENLKTWFEAGAACVGMGSKLITKEIVEAKDYERLTLKVKKTLKLIQEVRS